MNTNDIVRALRYQQEKHKNDALYTGGLNISAMVQDAADHIEILLARITALETEKAELLKQIVALAGETVRETEVAREEINRLAAYKDTGLEPEEVARFAQAMRDAVRGAAVGEWTDGPDEDYMICSNCDEPWNVYDNDTHRFKFCPNCGADMRVGDTE